MKIAVFVLTFFLLAASDTFAQAKGIDTQNQQIKDIGTSQGPTDNGNKRNVGAGRGIDFGAGKTPDRLPLANPFRLASRRDVLVTMISDLMTERGLVMDEAASRPADGVIISQPYTFAKGAIVAQSELQRFADLPDNTTDSAYTRARYTLTVEVQSIDGTNNNVSVTAKVEGRSQSATTAEWTTLRTSGLAENEFLAALVERMTGTSPYDVPKPVERDEEKPAPKEKDNLLR